MAALAQLNSSKCLFIDNSLQPELVEHQLSFRILPVVWLLVWLPQSFFCFLIRIWELGNGDSLCCRTLVTHTLTLALVSLFITMIQHLARARVAKLNEWLAPVVMKLTSLLAGRACNFCCFFCFLNTLVDLHFVFLVNFFLNKSRLLLFHLQHHQALLFR